MSKPTAGSRRKGMFSEEEYLAPPHIPTGQPPKDVLNVIWRKNDVFMDIGEYSIGSFVMMIWPMLLITYFLMGSLRENASTDVTIAYWALIFCFGIYPILMLFYILSRPVPLPTRFNRQRREVCVPQKDGSYWIVPWEQVKAQAVAMHSIGQHGKTTQGLLVVGFNNPDPNAAEENKHFTIGFSCGGGTTAMCLWECMRSYMEAGPEAVPKCNFEGEGSGRGLLGWLLSLFSNALRAFAKGEFKEGFKILFFTVFLGAPLGFYLQERKLLPPPDLTDPAVVKWSQSLPPEQWAKRSPELQAAIAERERDLAASTASQATRKQPG